MKIVDAGYEILTDISPYGTLELEEIEAAARTCYKSEDKYEDQGKSAQRLIKKLIQNGHEAMLEHSQLSVKFIVDRGISHELVRHRLASFAQESTRYCNYSDDRFDNEITVVCPYDQKILNRLINGDNYGALTLLRFLILGVNGSEEMEQKLLNLSDEEEEILLWWGSCLCAEQAYVEMVEELGVSPQIARNVLPNSLKTELVMTANYREWRHIFKLRCAKNAHPQMREVMLPLLRDLYDQMPVVWDDLFEEFFDEEGNPK